MSMATLPLTSFQEILKKESHIGLRVIGMSDFLDTMFA